MRDVLADFKHQYLKVQKNVPLLLLKFNFWGRSHPFVSPQFAPSSHYLWIRQWAGQPAGQRASRRRLLCPTRRSPRLELIFAGWCGTYVASDCEEWRMRATGACRDVLTAAAPAAADLTWRLQTSTHMLTTEVYVELQESGPLYIHAVAQWKNVGH